MILQCKSCTLRFLNLIPETKDELKTIYSSEYGAYNVKINIIERLFSKLMSLVIFKSSYPTYFDIPILDYEKQNNSMLDIGSGSGILSTLYSSQGWKVTSLDFNDDLKRLYHNNESITFVTGDAIKPDFPANTFDLIVASQILEHLPDPISALRNWHSISFNCFLSFVWKKLIAEDRNEIARCRTFRLGQCYDGIIFPSRFCI